MADSILQMLGIRPMDSNLLRDRNVPLDQPMPYDPSYQVPGSPPAQRVGDVAGGALQALPSVGDAYSVLQAIADLEAGNYGNAAWNGVAALPMVAGTFAGVGAKTADLLKLEKAHKLLADGVDPSSIWKETGWTNQFPDEKWRFEVDDSPSEYRPGRVKAEHLSSHLEGLQKDYDKLVHAKMLRSFMDADPKITVGKAKNLFRKHFEREPLEDSGLFAKTFTADRIQEMEDEALERLTNPRVSAPTAQYLENSGILEAYPELQGMPTVLVPEKNMGGALGSFGLSHVELSAPNAYRLGEGKQVLHHELQHAVQDLEGFARGGNPQEAVSFSQDDPYDWYRRLAGEAESRLVEKRLNYTPEQRQQIPPWTEFDVPVDRQIVR